jgi:hypothetical protein
MIIRVTRAKELRLMVVLSAVNRKIVNTAIGRDVADAVAQYGDPNSEASREISRKPCPPAT